MFSPFLWFVLNRIVSVNKKDLVNISLRAVIKNIAIFRITLSPMPCQCE